MMLYCDIIDERNFFEKYWMPMSDDFEYNLQKTMNNTKYSITEIELRNMLIEELTLLFSRNGAKISSYNIPAISRRSENHGINNLIEEERSYDILELTQKATEMLPN
jgi:hypothetical protein